MIKLLIWLDSIEIYKVIHMTSRVERVDVQVESGHCLSKIKLRVTFFFNIEFLHIGHRRENPNSTPLKLKLVFM